MKPLVCPVLFALGVLGSPVAFSADSAPPSTAVPVVASSLAGDYVGKWQGSDDAGGKLRLKLKQDGQTWSAEASFTFEGADIPTKIKGVKVDGKKVEVIIEWEIRDDTGQSTLTGEATDAQLSGTYQTTTATGTGSGTWTVTRA